MEMEEVGKSTPLSGHLLELRKRLVRSVIAIVIAFVFTYAYS